MFLKQGIAEGLLLEGRTTCEELAIEFDCPLCELNPVLDGNAEAGEALTLLLLSAFGVNIMAEAIDWERTM